MYTQSANDGIMHIADGVCEVPAHAYCITLITVTEGVRQGPMLGPARCTYKPADAHLLRNEAR